MVAQGSSRVKEIIVSRSSSTALSPFFAVKLESSIFILYNFPAPVYFRDDSYARAILVGKVQGINTVLSAKNLWKRESSSAFLARDGKNFDFSRKVTALLLLFELYEFGTPMTNHTE